MEMPWLLESCQKRVSEKHRINQENIGVVLAAEKKEHSPLFIPTRESGKLYKIDDHIMCSVSGIVADANYLIDYGRVHSQRH